MLKQLIRPIYQGVHDIMHATLPINPLFPKTYNGKAVKKGHLSAEHLANPALDHQLIKDLSAAGIKTDTFTIDVAAYRQYIKEENYPESYYGGGKDPQQNFTEKTLEHFVSTYFMNFESPSVFIDGAACTSPFYKIVQHRLGVDEVYQQDLVYPKGQNGDKIGGFAHEIPFEDNSVDVLTLHCSLEHFEGISDTQFFQTMDRVLKPGGRVIVLPFYIGYEYTIHVDPAFNFLKQHKVNIDDDKAQLRYASWYQYFSRHYDVSAIQERILDKTQNLELTVYQVTNFKEVDESCYLRFIGVFEKK